MDRASRFGQRPLGYGEPDWESPPTQIHGITLNVPDIPQRLLSDKSYEELRYERLLANGDLQNPSDPPTRRFCVPTPPLNSLRNKTQMINVAIGNDRWAVHQELFASRSKFVEAILTHGFRERQEGLIRLPEEDPSNFDHYVHYLYSGSIATSAIGDLIRMYTLGSHLLDETFGSACYEIVRSSNQVWTPAEVQFTLENNLEEDRLRELCLEKVGQGILDGKYVFNDHHTQSLLGDHMLELMQSVTRIVAKNRWFTTPPSKIDEPSKSTPGGFGRPAFGTTPASEPLQHTHTSDNLFDRPTVGSSSTSAAPGGLFGGLSGPSTTNPVNHPPVTDAPFGGLFGNSTIAPNSTSLPANTRIGGLFQHAVVPTPTSTGASAPYASLSGPSITTPNHASLGANTRTGGMFGPSTTISTSSSSAANAPSGSLFGQSAASVLPVSTATGGPGESVGLGSRGTTSTNAVPPNPTGSLITFGRLATATPATATAAAPLTAAFPQPTSATTVPSLSTTGQSSIPTASHPSRLGPLSSGRTTAPATVPFETKQPTSLDRRNAHDTLFPPSNFAQHAKNGSENNAEAATSSSDNGKGKEKEVDSEVGSGTTSVQLTPNSSSASDDSLHDDEAERARAYDKTKDSTQIIDLPRISDVDNRSSKASAANPSTSNLAPIPEVEEIFNKYPNLTKLVNKESSDLAAKLSRAMATATSSPDLLSDAVASLLVAAQRSSQQKSQPVTNKDVSSPGIPEELSADSSDRALGAPNSSASPPGATGFSRYASSAGTKPSSSPFGQVSGSDATSATVDAGKQKSVFGDGEAFKASYLPFGRSAYSSVPSGTSGKTTEINLAFGRGSPDTSRTPTSKVSSPFGSAPLFGVPTPLSPPPAVRAFSFVRSGAQKETKKEENR